MPPVDTVRGGNTYEEANSHWTAAWIVGVSGGLVLGLATFFGLWTLASWAFTDETVSVLLAPIFVLGFAVSWLSGNRLARWSGASQRTGRWIAGVATVGTAGSLVAMYVAFLVLAGWALEGF